MLNINFCVNFWHIWLTWFCWMCSRSTCGRNIANLQHRLIYVDQIHNLWGKWLNIFHIPSPSACANFQCDPSYLSCKHKMHCIPPRHMHEPFTVRVELINILYFPTKKLLDAPSSDATSNQRSKWMFSRIQNTLKFKKKTTY